MIKYKIMFWIALLITMASMYFGFFGALITLWKAMGVPFTVYTLLCTCFVPLLLMIVTLLTLVVSSYKEW